MAGSDGIGASRLACVAGGPGEGKSTIAAALCRHGDLVHAAHFCKASDVLRQDLGVVVRSLAYQLATARVDATTLRFPTFAKALLALDDAAMEGLSNGPAKAFEVLLKQPLLKLPSNERVVLTIDALDEAEVAERPVSKVLYLLLSLGRLTGGPSLSIVTTTRPEAVILDALQARWQAGFRRFFSPGELRLAPAVAEEATKLLHLLNSRLVQRGLSTAAANIDAAYSRFFDSVPRDVQTTRLVNILLAARQPPSLMLLEELGVRAALIMLPGWGSLFYEQDYCVHLIHKSLTDWLLDASRRGEHACDVAAGNAAWADVLSKQLSRWIDQGGAAPTSGSYVYAHALVHLGASRRIDEACRLLLQLPWLQSTLRERGVSALIQDLAACARDNADVACLHRAMLFGAPGLQGAEAWEMLPGVLCGRLIAAVGKAETAPASGDCMMQRVRGAASVRGCVPSTLHFSSLTTPLRCSFKDIQLRLRPLPP